MSIVLPMFCSKWLEYQANKLLHLKWRWEQKAYKRIYLCLIFYFLLCFLPDSRSPTATYHRASLISPFQPFVLPGWHTGCLQFLPDHSFFWAIIHLVQTLESFLILHLATTMEGKQGEWNLHMKNNLQEKIEQYGSILYFPWTCN